MVNKTRDSGRLGYIFIGVFTVVTTVFLIDLLFSPPKHQAGIVVDKIYIPARSTTGPTPIGAGRRGIYSVTIQKQEQWIAITRLQNGDTVLVHCHPDQYKQKQVGDEIHFKEYEGELLHIKFLAHNEEEQ